MDQFQGFAKVSLKSSSSTVVAPGQYSDETESVHVSNYYTITLSFDLQYINHYKHS